MFISSVCVLLLVRLCANSDMYSHLANPYNIAQVRDRVLLDEGVELPWRRSGEWLAVKAVVHSKLASQQGDVTGTITYKLLLLRAHVQLGTALLQHLNSSNADNSSSGDSCGERVDLSMQVLAKVARRLCKLQALLSNAASSSTAVPHQLQHACHAALASVDLLTARSAEQ
jgi:hypothetical protein